MAKDPVDVCIIGSGAGGGTMAFALAQAGIKVCVLEKGAWYKDADFVHDEILSGRRNFFMPFPWDEPHMWRTDERRPYLRSNECWTANCVGGGTVHMSGYFYRLKPFDFRLRSELGAVAGANVADWPISYAELAPYYDKAEDELGVAGEVRTHPFLEPRKKGYPLPPLADHPVSYEIDRVAKGLGWNSLRTARAILSIPYRGRSACHYCTLCGSYGCESGAKSSTGAALLPRAVATGNVEVRPRAMAQEITVDASGAAKSVVYLDENGERQEQPARLVVVSATAVESARLLLNSKSGRFPNGLGNDAGLVGKNFVLSSFGQSRALFSSKRQAATHPWTQVVAPFVDRSVQDFYVMPDERFGFRKGGTLGFMWAHPNPIYAATQMAGSGKRGVFGAALKDRIRAYRDNRILEFEIYGEFLPTDGSRVGISDSVKDKYGIPVATIDIRRHPKDLVMTKFLVERGEEILQALQPEKVERIGIAGQTGILQGGTCRFGKDPATSVLDRNCRSHVVPNLYVVDGSFMPSSGGVPFTLTIIANAFRVADALVADFKKGKKKGATG